MPKLVHLVDDDPAVRETLARLLHSGGYSVRQYGSGAELIAASGALEPGFILLDVDMPGQDGFEVNRILASKSSDLPVIMMTGSGDLTILALKAGANDFMQKPFGRQELLDVLDQLSAEPMAGH